MGFLKSFAGGLFGHEESTTENAFKYAVYRINHEKNLLGGATLNYDTRRLSAEDAFTSSMDSKYNIQVVIVTTRTWSFLGVMTSCGIIRIH